MDEEGGKSPLDTYRDPPIERLSKSNKRGRSHDMCEQSDPDNCILMLAEVSSQPPQSTLGHQQQRLLVEDLSELGRPDVITGLEDELESHIQQLPLEEGSDAASHKRQRVWSLSSHASGECDTGQETSNLNQEKAVVEDTTAMDLTDDLLHLVFSFLDQKGLCVSAMVCRQWRTATAHEDFWKSLNLEGENVTEEKVGWLCDRFPKAIELSLMGVPSVDEVARKAMHSLRGLERLNLHKGNLTESFFGALSYGCFALQELSISDAVLGSGGSQEVLIQNDKLHHLRVTKCRVMRIAIRCPLLNALSLQRTTMASVILQCPDLLSLDLSSCHKLSDAGLRAAATGCPALLALDMSHCSYVSDETLREISISCLNLQTLDASQCPNISLEGVCLPMLRNLRLRNCEGINSTSMAALSQCSRLESVKLDLCGLLSSVTLDLQNLQSFTLVNCRKFVDLTLNCPRLVEISISSCPILKYIDISSIALKRLVLQDQASLTTMSLRCPYLASVDLSECSSISNSICKVFSEGGGCPRLVSLTLDDCESLTAVSLSSTSLEYLSLAGCRKLQSLELGCGKLLQLYLDGCDHLTAVTLNPVGLQSLNLGICPRVKDLMIEAPEMTSLDLKGCGALSHATIYCPQLVFIDAFYCSHLGDDFLEATTTSCPSIQTLILASCTSIGPPGLLVLKNLASLTVLDLSYTFLTDLSPIFEACPLLKTLKLLACKYLDDTALDALYLEKTLPELRELDLSYGSLGHAALEGLLSHCCHLTHVNLNGCINLDNLNWESKSRPQCLLPINRETGRQSYNEIDQSFFTGAPSNQEISTKIPEKENPIQAHALQFLNCVGCPNIKKVVITDATGFRSLLSLNLSLSSNITEVRLECSNLTSLNLSNCNSLVDLDIKCPRLVSLWLQAACIEESILEGVLQGCSALETLDIRNCGKISFEALADLRAACPRLKRLLNTVSIDYVNTPGG